MTQITTMQSITPAKAEKFMRFNTSNRPLRQWWVRMLAGRMQRGEWLPTHQGIAFDTKGNMNDGQHRCQAIILSGVTVLMPVTTGVDPRTFEVIDGGIIRTAADALGLPTSIAYPLRFATRLVVGNGRTSMQQIRLVGDTGVRDAIEAVIDYCGRNAAIYSSSPVVLGAAVRLMFGAQESYVLGQYRALCELNFDAMSKISQAFVRQNKQGAKGNRDELFARAMRVFDPARRNATRVLVSPEDVRAYVVELRDYIRPQLPEGCLGDGALHGAASAQGEEARA